MNMRNAKLPRLMTFFGVLYLTFTLIGLLAAGSAFGANDRHIILTNTDDDHAKLKAEIVQKGGKIIKDMPEINMLVISAPSSVNDSVAASPFLGEMTKDRARNRIPREEDELMGKSGLTPSVIPKTFSAAKFVPFGFDPIFSQPDMMWNFDRLQVADAWRKTQGSKEVTVGILDTGIDYTHDDLKGQVIGVVDLSQPADPAELSVCQQGTVDDEHPNGISDSDRARELGLDTKFANLDFNGHGTTMAGIIAGVLNGNGTNGIAPRVKLVAIKTAQWCGFDNDSDEIIGIYKTPELGIDILSMSFGDVLDITDPDSKTLYDGYVRAVNYAIKHGTTIVSSAGNEHVRVSADGKIISHGSQTRPGRNVFDRFGQFPVPSGIPGVIDVSATVNVVEGNSLSCDPAAIGNTSPTGSNATCKPASDAHQPFGAGKKDQLAYYSNYGPRIDFAAPGGSRKFNLPHWDRGGTRGWPWTSADGYKAWGIFSIITNQVIDGILDPTVVVNFNSSDSTLALPFPLGFIPDQHYSTTIGTSEAAPHVAAVAALIASKHTEFRRQPKKILEKLKESVTKIRGNTTPPNSPDDESYGDRTGIFCKGNPNSNSQIPGYCHLGGLPIPDREAYGNGLINAKKAIE
jgi:subtilisin family serine protease